jgi:hypothetical protein
VAAKYLGQVNAHGAPDNAMWTDLAVIWFCVDVRLRIRISSVFVNCNYLIFNFLSLNAGWIHRLDNPECTAACAAQTS